MSATEQCEICNKASMRYKCPKCNILYCSVQCYKSQPHLQCSEEFYKHCIQDELANAEQKSRDDMQKIIDILRRMHEADAGLPANFTDDAIAEEDEDEAEADAAAGGEEELDSDDEAPAPRNNFDNEEDMDEDLAERLKNVDLDNADEIWECMTAAERKEFENMVASGDIMKFLPNYKPWWCVTKSTAKIVDLSAEPSAATNERIMPKPQICADIPKYESICQKAPSPCLHYNLWNIMSAYSVIVRFYANEHQTNPLEAVAQLVNLCLTFKFGTNFDEVEDAVTSVKMEALTMHNNNAMPGTTVVIDSHEELLSDARALMSSRSNKLAALSDIMAMLQRAKADVKLPKNADLAKLFAMCSGNVQLDRKKLTHLIRKTEFLLAYVNRDADKDLK